MSAYLSEDEVDSLRMQGVPVTGVPPKGCCARCRRGTKAHGTEPVCGYNGRCPNNCHGRNPS